VDAYRALRGHGLAGKKGLGQHFLVDQSAVRRIVDAAEVQSDDTVLEVGPGPGTLTRQLAEQAERVVAVELDERMLAPLHEQVKGHDNVCIVHGDILEQDVAALVGGGPYKVVANLPYYITSAVLRHLLESTPRPILLVVTVQREVAERILGRKGRRTDRMSLLAVSVQFYGRPQIVTRIPAGSFRPMPAVDSAVLRIDVYHPLPWDPVDERAFFRVVRAGFAQSRKQLHNALRHNLPSSAEELEAAFQRTGIDGRRRAETLSIEEWVTLSRALYPQSADE
jgi:16S rRNA (adenine1518-N6/adenine1519-N6)-dimethyltransferase